MPPSADWFERFAGFDRGLARLSSDVTPWGGLDALPSHATERRGEGLRSLAIRQRLRLLGYGRGCFGRLRPLSHWVRRFQADAGLRVDGWVGHETWGALQELVAIEPMFHLERWKDRPVLRRAVKLRLKLFGCWPQERSEHPRGAGLETFGQRCAALELADARGSPEGALELLFDFERLFTAVARQVLARTTPLDGELVTFVSQLVRVDLWLSGFSVGSLLESIDSNPTSRARFSDAISELRELDDLPPSAAAPSPAVDQRVLEVLLEDRKHEPIGHEHLRALALEHESRLKLEAERADSAPSFFLWDGLWRSGRWLARRGAVTAERFERWIQSGVKGAKAWIWNLLKLVYRRATTVITAIRRSVVAFAQGVELLARGEIRPADGSAAVACRIGLDGDARFWSAANATSAQREELVRRMTLMNTALRVGGLVLEATADVVTALAEGPIGWIHAAHDLIAIGPRFLSLTRALELLEP